MIKHQDEVRQMYNALHTWRALVAASVARMMFSAETCAMSVSCITDRDRQSNKRYSHHVMIDACVQQLVTRH